MRYIPDIDEQLVPPPYRLGADSQPFEAHHFWLPTNRESLQRLINAKLNAALWGALDDAQMAAAIDETDPANILYGPATRRVAGDEDSVHEIRYVVPDITHLQLSLVRYWRVDASQAPNLGASAYTECLIHFFVQRDVKDAEFVPPLFRFPGVVYIDDSRFRGQPRDPQALPIMLGRESYGLPKGPGEIYYCPHPGNLRNPRNPLVEIWDNPPGGFLKLAPAIVIDPSTLPKDDDCSPNLTPPDLPRRKKSEILATAFSTDPLEIDARLEREPAAGQQALVFTPRSGSKVMVFDDLDFYTKLVGLKQFPDATALFDVNDPSTARACHQSICESAVEEFVSDPVQYYSSSGGPHVVVFPPLHRVDLAAAFDIQTVTQAGGSKAVAVTDTYGKYTWGKLVFARPKRNTVWVPVVGAT